MYMIDSRNNALVKVKSIKKVIKKVKKYWTDGESNPGRPASLAEALPMSY